MHFAAEMILPPAALEAQRTQSAGGGFILPGDDGKGKIPVDSRQI
jgi:hypothetical protein